ncbi:hypothetical protein BKA70DRAFT_1285962 [Coprinopsis sp. MPI-PUGE-AT-0042]|nr:hypothetical protein BKA70DRAFT_1285962 [Coprinopsis sp. MPI-PUGE-AT-0042]
MATWFNRSGIHSPLALTVVQAVPQAAIGDILLDKNRHWVHLNLQVGSPFLNRLCHRLSTQDAAQCWSHARVLELGHSPFGPEYHLSSNFFNSIMAKRHYFPALRRLSLTRMAFITSSDTLSHATLSSLCLSVCLVGFPTIRSILDPRKLPSLQELSLVNVTFLLSEEAGQYSPLPHAGIRRLVMRGTSASVFLPMLNLPNLEFATFRSDSRSREHDVVSFLKRSGATLRGICFEGCGVSPAWISSMLWDLPKVEFVSAPSFEVFESWALLDARVLPTFKTFVCNGQVLNPTPQSIAATVSYVEKRGNLTEDPLIIQITARTSLENRDVFRSLEEHPGVQFQRVSQQDLCRDPFA